MSKYSKIILKLQCIHCNCNIHNDTSIMRNISRSNARTHVCLEMQDDVLRNSCVVSNWPHHIIERAEWMCMFVIAFEWYVYTALMATNGDHYYGCKRASGGRLSKHFRGTGPCSRREKITHRPGARRVLFVQINLNTWMARLCSAAARRFIFYYNLNSIVQESLPSNIT